MGMYTKLHCNIKLETNAKCINILNYMLHEKEIIDFEIPNHDLFKTETQRWEYMLNTCSFYFTGTNNSSLQDDGLGKKVLHCDCDFKNYENEIDLFLDWISQYFDNRVYYEFIGYEIYEEEKVPTLIYMKKGKYKKVLLDVGIVDVYKED